MAVVDKKMYSTKKEGDFPERIYIIGEKIQDLRYGSNPHQAGAFYRLSDGGRFFQRLKWWLKDFKRVYNPPKIRKDLVLGAMKELKTGKEGLSATNILDMNNALGIVKYFDDPACAVMKHINPSGVAVPGAVVNKEMNLRDIYITARDTDSRSAFGSVVGFNVSVDRDTAEEIMKTLVEVVVAPDYEEGVIGIFERTMKAGKGRNQKIRIVKMDNLDKLPKFEGDETYGYKELRFLEDGCFILEDPYLSGVKDKEDLRITTDVPPVGREYNDLLFTWRVCERTRSNAIVFGKEGRTVAVGTGEQERVGAAEKAINKAYAKYHDRLEWDYKDTEVEERHREALIKEILEADKGDLKDSVMASDGFIPFRDSIDLVAEHEIAAIIQPGGSERDQEVIDACNEYGIPMVFTGKRGFAHF